MLRSRTKHPEGLFFFADAPLQDLVVVGGDHVAAAEHPQDPGVFLALNHCDLLDPFQVKELHGIVDVCHPG